MYEDTVNTLVAITLDSGLDYAVPLDVSTLEARDDIRDMCSTGRCRTYGNSWTCPPACGSLETCAAEMQKYEVGVLMQTVGELRRPTDWKGMMAAREKHQTAFSTAVERVRELYPDALCLGSGGCIVCESCSYPDPCRFPSKATSSMEAYGLFVTDVCRKNDLPYYHGENTIAYTACILVSLE